MTFFNLANKSRQFSKHCYTMNQDCYIYSEHEEGQLAIGVYKDYEL